MIKIFFTALILLFLFGCATNFEPQITSLSAEPNPVSMGGTVTIQCTANDDDEPNLLKNESLDYSWSAAVGIITTNDSPEIATWIAPMDSGSFSISCKVTDQYNGADISTIEIQVQ